MLVCAIYYLLLLIILKVILTCNITTVVFVLPGYPLSSIYPYPPVSPKTKESRAVHDILLAATTKLEHNPSLPRQGLVLSPGREKWLDMR